MKENDFSEPTDAKYFTLKPDTSVIFGVVKKTRSKSSFLVGVLSLLMLFFFAGTVTAQVTLYTTGFESGQTGVIGSSNNAASFGTISSGGNFAPYCGQITAEGASSKSYDGSIITNTSLSFNTGKYYVVTVYAKVTSVTGQLRIMKSSTATNSAMKAATGSDIILNASSNNVTSSSWVKYTAGFTVTSNETKFIGFQMLQSGTGGAQMILDDISIVEYDSVQPESYCTPTGSLDCSGGYTINNVTINTLNNPSTCGAGGYTNYAATGTQTTSLLKGSSYNLSLTVGSGSGTHSAAVWIDFNQNGLFTDAGEYFSISNTITASSTTNVSISIPAGALSGNTRMRLRYSNIASVTSTTSCVIGNIYGETEDYTITLVTPAACVVPTAQPTVLSLTPSGTSIGGSFLFASPAPNNYLVVMNTTGTLPTIVNGTTYAIGGTVGAGNIIVNTENENTFTSTGLTPNTKYYFFVYSYNSACTGGPLYNTTSPLSGNTTTNSFSFCPPTSNVSTLYINSVQTVGNLTNMANLNTNRSINGYGDFTALPATT